MTTDRRLADSTMPEKVRIELNRLNRAVVVETDQSKCDEMEARIGAIESQYHLGMPR